MRSKYKDIFEIYVNSLPEEQDDPLNNFPHKKESIKLSNIASKLKAIRIKFRQAVDSGRRSGHGRVVMIYYELCEKLWGGSPATEQIEGVETVELITSDESNVNDNTATSDANAAVSDDNMAANSSVDVSTSNEPQESDGDGSYQQGEYELHKSTDKDNAKKRREFLNDKLKNYRQDKLKRKLPLDAEILHSAQEELTVKKQLIEQINTMNKDTLIIWRK